MKTFLLPMLRTAALTTLMFVSGYYLPLIFAGGQFAQLGPVSGGVLLNAVVTLAYAVIAALVNHLSELVSRRGWTTLMLLFAVGGLAALAALLLVGAPPLAMAVVGCIYMMAVMWLNVIACASLASVPKEAFVVGASLTFPLSRIVTMPLGGFPEVAVLVCGLPVVIAVYLLASTPSREILDRYAGQEPPSSLMVTNTESFVPVSNAFVVSLLLFSFLRVALSEGAGDAAQPEVTVWALAGCAFVSLAFLARRVCPGPESLFRAGVLLCMAGALLVVVFPQAARSAPYDLSGAGVGLMEMVLVWYTVVLLRDRNVLATLPALILGRAALSLGALVAGIVTLAVREVEVLGTTAQLVVVGAALLVAVGFTFVSMGRFSFTDMAREIYPVSAPVVSEGRRESERGEGGAAAEIAAARDFAHGRLGLTPREADVFSLLARGRSYRYVQEALGLRLSTVKSHVRNIYGKLGIHSQQELIDLYERRGGSP